MPVPRATFWRVLLLVHVLCSHAYPQARVTGGASERSGTKLNAIARYAGASEGPILADGPLTGYWDGSESAPEDALRRYYLVQSGNSIQGTVTDVFVGDRPYDGGGSLSGTISGDAISISFPIVRIGDNVRGTGFRQGRLTPRGDAIIGTFTERLVDGTVTTGTWRVTKRVLRPASFNFSSSIDVGGERFFLALWAPAGSTISAEVFAERNGSSLDPILRLSESDGLGYVAENDDFIGLDSRLENERATQTPPGSQLYYLSVRGYGTTTGPFTVSVSIRPVGPSSLPAVARIVALPFRGPGVIDPVGRADVYGLNLTENMRLITEVIAAREGSALDSVLTMLAPDGITELARNDDTFGTDSRIEFTAPSTDRYFVVVQDYGSPDGGRNYFYSLLLNPVAPPLITSIWPTMGVRGTSIGSLAVEGRNFQPTSTLTFSGSGVTASAYRSRTSTDIVATVTILSTATPGPRDVIVTNPDSSQSRLSGAFTVLSAPLPAPRVTSVSPGSVFQADRMVTLAIIGQNFQGASRLSFSGSGIALDSYRSRTADRIEAVLTVADQAPLGPRDVVVTNPDLQQSVLAAAFTVLARPAPVITQISPTSARQGTTIRDFTIIGRNFHPSARLEFRSDGVPVGIVVRSFVVASTADRISATIEIVNGARVGPRDVVVTNPGSAEVRYRSFTVERGRSNVAFLPGIMGSRLYEDQFGPNPERWLPNFFGDMCALRPNDDGESVGRIYTKDIIDCATGFCDPFNVTDVYGDFIRFMDGLRARGDIKDWAPLPYDWRLSIKNLVENGRFVDKDGGIGIRRLEDEIMALAGSSATGQVTVVAHSNGGFVAKELITYLGSRARLIDALILVATPHWGTPETLRRLLHGDNVPLAQVLDNSIVRESSETMVGAYNLLPSRGFFELGPRPEPVIAFDRTDQAVQNELLVSLKRQYPNDIESYDELRRFLLGENGDRKEPFDGACNDAGPVRTTEPNVLRPNLLEKAETLHGSLDAWTPPDYLRVVQVAGWNLPTMRGIEYSSDCSDGACELRRKPLTTCRGDETVLAQSATAIAGVDIWYFDLRAFNKEPFPVDRHRDHASIMGADSVHRLIEDVLEGRRRAIRHFSLTAPATANCEEDLRITATPSLDIEAFDQLGRRTGFLPHPERPGAFLIQKEIPNSTLSRWDGQVYLTLSAGQEQRIELRGRAVDLVTVQVEQLADDRMVAARTFLHIPISSATRARFRLRDVRDVSELELDLDGDGVTDFLIPADERPDLSRSLRMLAGLASTLGLPPDVAARLAILAGAASAEGQRGNLQGAQLLLEAFIRDVSMPRGSQMSEEVAQGLSRIGNKLLRLTTQAARAGQRIRR